MKTKHLTIGLALFFMALIFACKSNKKGAGETDTDTMMTDTTMMMDTATTPRTMDTMRTDTGMGTGTTRMDTMRRGTGTGTTPAP